MSTLENSLLILTQEWNSILGILYIFLLGSGIVFLCLKIVFDSQFTFGEYLVLGVGGGLLPLFLGISLAWLVDLVFGIKNDLTVFCEIVFMICLVIYWRKGNYAQAQSLKFFSFALILILVISVYIRLGFISGLVVPLYFDSAMHYSIIRDLITNFETSTLPTYSSFVGGYYHLGFHVLAAALSLALHIDAKDVILILGQIVLAVIPLPLFFIVRQETKLDLAGIFATLLAGWGWYMPAHAVNWGKYPALTSILAFEFVVCSAYLVLKSPKRHRWILVGVSGFSILVSTFIHTRSLVLIVIALISAITAISWRRLPGLARNLVFCLVMAGLFTLVFIVQLNPILNMSLDPYRGSSLWMTLLVLLLLPFAFKEFPQATFSIITALLLLLNSLFLSVTQFLPIYAAQTLLDRPFVEMALFFPLALLGGLGYAGLVRTVKNLAIVQGARQKWAQGAILLFIFGVFFFNFAQYNFSPSCCQLFGEDDQAALAWMDKNSPLSANIVIASSEANVFEASPTVGYTGSDGGIWITPLIHRNVLLLPHDTDFRAQSAFVGLCQRGALYVYVGGTDQSFDQAQLQSRPDWYERLFSLPKAQVYKIVGCDRVMSYIFLPLIFR